jgi:hypothetical protein
MPFSSNDPSSFCQQGVDRESFFSHRAFLRRACAGAGATVALASGGLLLRTGQRAGAQQFSISALKANLKCGCVKQQCAG